MSGINYIENQSSLVISIDKSAISKEPLDLTKQFFLYNDIDTSHIPYVDDEEQKEIEELLKNEDCHIFGSKTTYDLKSGELFESQQIKMK